MPGVIFAAPSSGAGKTTVTLGVLRALRAQGVAVRSAKSGPDYIDPQFHAAATGQPCVNLDAWAMSEDTLNSLAAGNTPLIIEGAMGLFDGAPPDGKGSVADLARQLNLPVVLIVDAKSMSQSVLPLVQGFAQHDPNVRVAGVIFNNVGSPRHEDMLRTALKPSGLPVLGAMHRSDAINRPSRHLGLVQAGEMPDLDAFLDITAARIVDAIDLNAVLDLMSPCPKPGGCIPPLFSGIRTLALAQDAAFSFVYPHHIAAWTQIGVEIRLFSPLADDTVPDADAVFLPGGYPELYAGTLARNSNFMQSLKSAAQSTKIYGECGGYMVLGEVLIDANGTRHTMAGLLGLTTSFETRKLHLGYRSVTPRQGALIDGPFKAHEFHYATTLRSEGTPLFFAEDATGAALPDMGLVQGNVAGSFAHLIAPAL